jgi:hypothetical protein
MSCEQLYLTAQELVPVAGGDASDGDKDDEDDDEDLPPVMNPLPTPMHLLRRDVPMRLQLLPTLVPQQLNVWMGNSVSGSSSGLHHDFHDNL